MKRQIVCVALVSAMAMTLSACGGSNSSAGSQGANSEVSFEGRGPITYVQGKDNAGKLQSLIDQWNEKHPDEEVTLIELSSEADQQRQSMIQNAQTKSDAYCVESVDNVWVGEFAANQWILELPKDEFEQSDFLAPVWDTGLYRDKLYAVPFASDGGILYYRSDLLQQAGFNEAPKTWDEAKQQCEAVRKLPGQGQIACYAGQLAKYEGLTVNVDEAIHSAGGAIIDPSTGDVVVDSPEARKGVQWLVDWLEAGYISKEALNYKEEDGRNAFESGKVLFMNNWPYAYSIMQTNDKVKFDVAPLPGFTEGKVGSSSLGGHNVGISAFCKNKATALDFVKWYASAESQQYMLEEESLAPVYGALYDDAENQKVYPYLPVLKKSIEAAYPRPQVPNYGDVTAAIQDAVFPALTGETDVDTAIKTLNDELNELVK